MSEISQPGIELRSFEEFEKGQLGKELQDIVYRNAPYLETRGFVKILDLYGGSPENAVTSVAEAQSQARLGLLGHFAIMNPGESGEVIGAGFIHPGRLLKKLGHIKLTELPFAAPFIRAWVDIHNDDPNRGLNGLAPAYSLLSEIALSPPWRRPNRFTWTLEPASSNKAYREAIAEAGLVEIATGLYDDGEIRRNHGQTKFVPPKKSILYATFYGECVSHNPRRMEHRLRKG